MLELTPQQISILERLIAGGFAITPFPLYANAIGVQRGECAALLVPAAHAPLAMQGEPCYLLKGNLAVAVIRQGKKMYVWKKEAVEATPQREAELSNFRQDLLHLLESPPGRSPGAPPLNPL